jgi:hypothetical protein
MSVGPRDPRPEHLSRARDRSRLDQDAGRLSDRRRIAADLEAGYLKRRQPRPELHGSTRPISSDRMEPPVGDWTRTSLTSGRTAQALGRTRLARMASMRGTSGL